MHVRVESPSQRELESLKASLLHPRTRGQTLPLPFPLLTSFLLRVGEIYIFLPLFGSHSGPQFARSSRYHGDMLFRFLATQSQEEDDEGIRRLDGMPVS